MHGQNPVAFHARNLEVAQVSEQVWKSMAPTTFDNSFLMRMEPHEHGVDLEAYESLNDWMLEENESVTTRNFDKGVRTLTINITQICNLHCTYCAAGGDGSYGDPVAKITVEKTLPQIKFFMEKLSPGDNFNFILLGGEPLLYPEAIRLIGSYARGLAEEKQATCSFNVITNGTLINDSNLQMLVDLNANITFSIDGAPEQHDKARPQKNGQGSSVAVLAGLEKLLSRKKEIGAVILHAVFSKSNLEVEKAYRFFSQFDVDGFEFTFDVTESDSDCNRRFMQEMTAVAALAFEIGGEKELRKISLFNGYFKALDEQIRTENYCGSGKSLLSLDSRNKIYTCPLDVGFKSEQVGDGVDLAEGALNSYQDSLITKNNCQTCWARFMCGGGCMFVHKSLTKNKHKKHISFCERTRYLISLAVSYYERCRG